METQRYSNVTRALSETPWAILPDTFAAILEAVSLRAQGKTLSDEELEARIGAGPTRRVGYTHGNVQVLPLYGTIFPRANLVSEMSGGTSLQQWAAAFDEAVKDARVDAILIDVHSPGGSTALVADVAAKIRAARNEKHVVAIANALCASAAYHLASQAQEIIASPSSLVGSIGVFLAHEDWSRHDDIEGIKTTLIHAGRYKVEGNPYEPLGDEARDALQALVDDTYELFVADVAAGRRTTAAKVRDGYGQGRVLTARQALAEGMVDRIETFEQTLERLKSSPAASVAPTRARAELAADLAHDRHMTLEQARAVLAALAPQADDPTDEPEPEPGNTPADQPDDELDTEEAFASLRAVASDIREDIDAAAALKTLRSLHQDMRTATTPGGTEE